MEKAFETLHNYPYLTYSIAVICFTAAIRHSFFKGYAMGPKWLTLIVGVALALAFFFMNWIDLETSNEFLVMASSLGLSTVMYDYLIKVIIDLIKRRNPFVEK